MPAPITWDDLAKTVEDLTTISEEIDAKIITHDESAESHHAAEEALGVHAGSDPIDHSNYSIYAIKIGSESQVADKVMKSDGAGGAVWGAITDPMAMIWAIVFGG